MPRFNNPGDKKEQRKEQRREIARAFSAFSQMGITLFLCVAIGIFSGRFLDERFGSSPWLLLIFTFIGMGAAIKSIVDMGKR